MPVSKTRKRSSQDYIQASSLLEQVGAFLQDGLILLDEHTVITYLNDAAKSGFEVGEEVVGKTFLNIIEHATKVGHLRLDMEPKRLAEAITSGRQVTYYAEVLVPESLPRHIQAVARPVGSGKGSGYVITARDVTSLIEKTMEANVMTQKAQRHTRELSELAELGSVFGFKLGPIFQKYLGKIVYMLDSGSAAIYSYEPSSQELVRRAGTEQTAEFKSKYNLGDQTPVSIAFVTQKPQVGQQGGNLLAVPVVFHSKALGVIAVSNRQQPYVSHDVRMLNLIADRLAVIVENANLYHDVNSRRERWEAVFKFTEEGIVIFDREGKIVGFNPAAVALTNYSVKEVTGQSFSKVIKSTPPDGSDPGASLPLKKVLDDGQTITNSEQLIETKTGEHIYTEISYSPIFDAAGHVTSGIAIIRNTQKDREIEEIKSDFISIVSHELRTPLSAIKGFLSMILKKDFGELNDKQFHFLNRVYQSNQRMIDLVEDLLDVSYIESGKINLIANPIALENIIAEVVTELASKGFERQIMLKVNRRQRLPLVLADERRLRQVMINLVDNAIKYSLPKSEVKIDFKVQHDELITSVSDSGVGMPPGQIDRIFQKFGRIYNPMSLQAGGTGLGLYIVKNLVESHGGRIWVTSRENKGSKFSFSLPIAKQLPLLG